MTTATDTWEIRDRGSDRARIVWETQIGPDSDSLEPVTIEYSIDRGSDDIGWRWDMWRPEMEDWDSDGCDDRWWTLIPDVPPHIRAYCGELEGIMDELRWEATGR